MSSSPISVWNANRSPPRRLAEQRHEATSVSERSQDLVVRLMPQKRFGFVPLAGTTHRSSYRGAGATMAAFGGKSRDPLAHQRSPRDRGRDRRQHGVRGRVTVEALQVAHEHRLPAARPQPPSLLPPGRRAVLLRTSPASRQVAIGATSKASSCAAEPGRREASISSAHRCAACCARLGPTMLRAAAITAFGALPASRAACAAISSGAVQVDFGGRPRC